MFPILLVLASLIAAAAALFAYRLLIGVCLGMETRADETYMVATDDDWQIRLCRYRPLSGEGEPVLICHGAFANEVNFTEPKGRSLVDTLVDRGFCGLLSQLRGWRRS